MIEKFQGVQHIVGFVNDLDTVVSKSSSIDLYDNSLIDNFCSRYKDWILSSTSNKIQGLDQFNFVSYSNGTTEAFDKFRIRHREKDLRVLKDEYLYHRLYLDADIITDIELLKTGQALIISAPYAKTGEIHPLMESILNRCDQLNIPVLIDSAYFGLCSNLEFNFDHPCIEDVTFSLSKVFGTSYYRIGIRFSKCKNDSMTDFGTSGYVNRLGAVIGNHLFDRFGPDDLFSSFRETQIQFCNSLNLVPSNSVIFGIDQKNIYNQNPRPDEKGRFCFSKYLISGTLPT